MRGIDQPITDAALLFDSAHKNNERRSFVHKGWTQRQLAEAASIRIATNSRIENHPPQTIDLTVLDRITSALA